MTTTTKASARTKLWREDHPEQYKAYMRKYVADHREHLNTLARAGYKRKIVERRAKRTQVHRALRKRVIAEYGGKCTCCGLTEWEFLNVHHEAGRKAWGHHAKFGGVNFYYWLHKQGFPKVGFRLLCFNCNCSKGSLGYCPHEREAH